MSALQTVFEVAASTTGSSPVWLGVVASLQRNAAAQPSAAASSPPAAQKSTAPPSQEPAAVAATAAPPPAAAAAASPPSSSAADVLPAVSDTPMADGPLVVGVDSTDPALEIEYARLIVTDARRRIGGGLHGCSDWLRVREDLFRAAAIFQVHGYAAEAAEAFNQSASVSRIMGAPNEVLATTAFAVEGYKSAGDYQQSISLLKEQFELHMQEGRTIAAARAAKHIGEIYASLDGQCHEEALQHFLLALPLYEKSANCRDQVLAIRFKAACLFALTKRYRESSQFFEVLAEQRQLTSRTQCYALAMMALLCDTDGEKWAGGLARAKTIFERYQDLDKNFQSGVEYNLVRGIIEACGKPSLAMLDASLNKYKQLRPTCPDLPFIEALGAITRHNLFSYLLPYM